MSDTCLDIHEANESNEPVYEYNFTCETKIHDATSQITANKQEKTITKKNKSLLKSE